MDSNHNLTPNVQTLFTAATNRRDMKLLSSGSSPADNRPLADSRPLRSSVDQTASLEGRARIRTGCGALQVPASVAFIPAHRRDLGRENGSMTPRRVAE